MRTNNETPALAGDRGFEKLVIAGSSDTLEDSHSRQKDNRQPGLQGVLA